MSELKKQGVVIIGVSFSSRLALARSVGVLGYDITVIAWGVPGKDNKPIDGYSKYVKRWFICQKEENAFITLLKEKCVDPDQKVVLIPDCDFSVTMIDLHLDELTPFFRIPHIRHRQGAIVEWSDKTRQKELAAKLGMNVAKSSVIEIIDGKYSIPESIQYPCFPKALASVAGGKAGMFCCYNKDDLSRSLNEIIIRKKVDAKVMVEEFMDIEKEYAVLGFSDGENVMIPGVIQFIVGSKTQKGIALQGKIMPVSGFEQIIDRFKVFVKEIGLVGLFDIDFYKCKGKLYFSELNIRYGGSGYAVVKMGVNLPAMFVESLCGNSMPDWDKQVGKTAVYTNERMAFNDLNNGLITVKEYRHCHGLDTADADRTALPCLQLQCFRDRRLIHMYIDATVTVPDLCIPGLLCLKLSLLADTDDLFAGGVVPFDHPAIRNDKLLALHQVQIRGRKADSRNRVQWRLRTQKELRVLRRICFTALFPLRVQGDILRDGGIKTEAFLSLTVGAGIPAEKLKPCRVRCCGYLCFCSAFYALGFGSINVHTVYVKAYGAPGILCFPQHDLRSLFTIGIHKALPARVKA